MKKPLFTGALLALAFGAYAQTDEYPGNSLQKLNDKTNQQITELNKRPNSILSQNIAPHTNDTPPVSIFQSYSKFDFITGEQLIAYEDFSQTEIGSFPKTWNTNGLGEITTLNNLPGKWLSMGQNATYRPEFIVNDLPENFTFEFDLALNAGKNTGGFYVQLGNAAKTTDTEPTNYGAEFRMVGGGEGFISIENWCYADDCKKLLSVSNSSETHFNSQGEKIRVSIWRQKERLRIYINETKVIDEFKLLDAKSLINCINFKVSANANSKFAYVSNIKLSAGTPDVHKKLILGEKFTTSGVLFDADTDLIRPESYSTLKEIAQQLKENPSVKVKIIGPANVNNTDADLSKRKAEAIRNSLITEFKISESRLQTEGRGPITSNDTVTLTGDNLQIEFLKLPK
ncbi:OmpA family protein [Solitalea sp. MAHUQ-68]|uniref:OmpA family protein n=1 Tax=Solitalea agri TaxID=2953739 RepID=A0A9X2JDL0_9SPHI|nr:OmpA family protein [Solitalea agri]MCO4294263.1 OmpA family protein [Solitalea agri]